MKVRKEYVITLKACMGLCTAAMLLLAGMLRAENYWPLLIAFALVGEQFTLDDIIK